MKPSSRSLPSAPLVGATVNAADASATTAARPLGSPLRARLRSGAAALVLATFAFGVLPACTTVRIDGDRDASYRMGVLETRYERSFDRVYEATKRALDDLGYFQTGDDRKVREAVLLARAGDDTRIEIKLKEISPGVINVRVRHGVPGNIAGAQGVIAALDKRL